MTQSWPGFRRWSTRLCSTEMTNGFVQTAARGAFLPLAKGSRCCDRARIATIRCKFDISRWPNHGMRTKRTLVVPISMAATGTTLLNATDGIPFDPEGD